MKSKATIEGTLLEALGRLMDAATKSAVRKLIKHHRVAVDGAVQGRPDFPVVPGQLLEVLPAREQPVKEPPPRAGSARRQPLAILFEDEHLIAVDKPAGLLSIATDKEQQKTLYRLVSAHVKEASGGRGRIFIVHRLDRDVSGVMVFAKDEIAKRRLQKSWGTAEKIYQAVVEGRPPEEAGTVRSWLCENRAFQVYACDPAAAGAQEAVTHYRLLRTAGPNSVLEVRIETGRKHQIRVHLASLGCPIVGDKVYGGGRSGGGIALHAHSLTFDHPFTGRRVTISSPLPQRFRKPVPASPESPQRGPRPSPDGAPPGTAPDGTRRARRAAGGHSQHRRKLP
jgi:23S rRNA pseudouridine1911/1915/1917 synthase